MGHTLIIGMTMSGKTTLAKQLCQRYRQKGIKTIVLDPLFDEWGADFQTDDPAEFMAIVSDKETRSCALFIDESGESIGQYNKEMFWLATRARHYGHNSHFIVQRLKQIAPTVRGQCEFLYLFNSPAPDCKELANEWNEPKILEASRLPKGQCIFTRRMDFAKTKIINVFD